MHRDLLDAALALPAKLSADLVQHAKTWLRPPYHIGIARTAGDWMVKLAKAGHHDEALEHYHGALDENPEPRQLEAMELFAYNNNQVELQIVKQC